MRAAQIGSYGGPEVLNLADIDTPSPGPGQVLIEVHGSSINPVDVALRSGWMQEYFPLQLPVTLGMDVAGTVLEVGDGVTELAVGDPVYGWAAVPFGGSGGFAEYAVAHAGTLAAAPAGLDLVTTGALAHAGVSALQAVAEGLGVQEGDRVLVHGASGGVGLYALAIAKHLGAHVVASAHGAGVTAVDGAGPDEVVDTDQTDLASLEPFDLTLDLVSQDPVLPVAVTKPGGSVVSLLAPADQEAADAKGVSTSLQFTEVNTGRLERLAELAGQGVVLPRIVDTFALGDISAAFARKEAGGAHGKISVAVR